MTFFDDQLVDIEAELTLGHGEAPEEMLTELLQQLPPAEFRDRRDNLLR